MPPYARENSYDSYPEYEMLLILITGGPLMTGLQPHHYLARRRKKRPAKD